MNDKPRMPDDFDGLDELEAQELGEVVEALKADRHSPADDRFWDALNQRILNELAVTPMPQSPSAGSERKGRGMIGWLRSTLATPMPAKVALASSVALAAIAVVLWLFTWRSPTAPTREHQPDQVAASPEIQQPLTPTKEIIIPEELWSEGFLAKTGLALDDDDVEAWLTAESDTELLLLGLEDPLPTEGIWSLDSLTQEELLELERLLDG